MPANTFEQGAQFSNLVQSRRSIRKGFSEQLIPEEVVTDIIQSGIKAPSSKDAQPWHIHIVRKGPLLNDIAEEVQEAKIASQFVPIDPAKGEARQWLSTVVESAQILREVALGLFIENTGDFSSGKKAILASSEKIQEKALTGYGLEMIGLGALMQNMWLTAHGYGLAGVFIGDVLVAEEYIKRRLRILGDLVGVLAVGYSSSSPTTKALKPCTSTNHPSLSVF